MPDSPTLQIGSQTPLGFALQTGGFNAPASTPDFYIDHKDSSIKYQTSAHPIDTASGTRASENEGARGKSFTDGSFSVALRTVIARPLLEAHFGTTTPDDTTETLSVSSPSLLTIFQNLSGEMNILQDSVLNELKLASSSVAEWDLTFSVLGGLRTLGDTGSPSVDFSGSTLAWADTNISGIGDTVPCQISAIELTLSNNAINDFGAGNHAACVVAGGKYTARLGCHIRYDSAASAAVEQAYVDGQHLGDITLTIGPSEDQHVIVFPDAYILTSEPMSPLADFFRLNVTIASLSASGCTWTLPKAI